MFVVGSPKVSKLALVVEEDDEELLSDSSFDAQNAAVQREIDEVVTAALAVSGTKSTMRRTIGGMQTTYTRQFRRKMAATVPLRSIAKVNIAESSTIQQRPHRASALDAIRARYASPQSQEQQKDGIDRYRHQKMNQLIRGKQKQHQHTHHRRTSSRNSLVSSLEGRVPNSMAGSSVGGSANVRAPFLVDKSRNRQRQRRRPTLAQWAKLKRAPSRLIVKPTAPHQTDASPQDEVRRGDRAEQRGATAEKWSSFSDGLATTEVLRCLSRKHGQLRRRGGTAGGSIVTLRMSSAQRVSTLIIGDSESTPVERATPEPHTPEIVASTARKQQQQQKKERYDEESNVGEVTKAKNIYTRHLARVRRRMHAKRSLSDQTRRDYLLLTGHSKNLPPKYTWNISTAKAGVTYDPSGPVAVPIGLGGSGRGDAGTSISNKPGSIAYEIGRREKRHLRQLREDQKRKFAFPQSHNTLRTPLSLSNFREAYVETCLLPRMSSFQDEIREERKKKERAKVLGAAAGNSSSTQQAEDTYFQADSAMRSSMVDRMVLNVFGGTLKARLALWKASVLHHFVTRRVYIRPELTPDLRSEFRRLFDSCDVDFSNTIDENELSLLLEVCGFGEGDTSRTRAAQMMASIDTSDRRGGAQNPSMTFHEFIYLIQASGAPAVENGANTIGSGSAEQVHASKTLLGRISKARETGLAFDTLAQQFQRQRLVERVVGSAEVSPRRPHHRRWASGSSWCSGDSSDGETRLTILRNSRAPGIIKDSSP